MRLARSESFAVLGEGGEEGYQQSCLVSLLASFVWKGFVEPKGEREFQERRLFFVLFAERFDFGERESVLDISQLVGEDELCKGLGYEGLRAGFFGCVLGCRRFVRAGGCKQGAEGAEDGEGSVFHEEQSRGGRLKLQRMAK